MWCPDDIGRDSWDWVGPPAWERACFNYPEWGGGSSPVRTEPLQIVVWLLLLLLLTQIDEPAMPMSTQLNDLLGNPGAESPGSKLPATPAPPAPVTDTSAPKNPVPDHATQPVKLVKRTSSVAKCEPRKARMQWKNRLGTLLHSNRMEKQVGPVFAVGADGCSRPASLLFPRMRLRDSGSTPFVLLHRVFDVLSLCFLLVLVGCPREVHLVQ